VCFVNTGGCEEGDACTAGGIAGNCHEGVCVINVSGEDLYPSSDDNDDNTDDDGSTDGGNGDGIKTQEKVHLCTVTFDVTVTASVAKAIEVMYGYLSADIIGAGVSTENNFFILAFARTDNEDGTVTYAGKVGFKSDTECAKMDSVVLCQTDAASVVDVNCDKVLSGNLLKYVVSGSVAYGEEDVTVYTCDDGTETTDSDDCADDTTAGASTVAASFGVVTVAFALMN